MIGKILDYANKLYNTIKALLVKTKNKVWKINYSHPAGE